MAETTWDYTLQDYSPLFLYSSAPGNGSRLAPNLDSAWSQSCPFQPAGPLNNSLCDVSSVHRTNRTGATISFDFHGQGVQFFGNVTGALQFNVTVDGAAIRGAPAGQMLASVSGLRQSDHTVSLTVTQVGPGSQLLFESAIVTVGTGFTGANVTRTIVQDSDPSVSYGAGWSQNPYNVWNITHSSNNGTWHQLNLGLPGEANVFFSGMAVMAHGFSWSFSPTRYRMSIDDGSPTIYSSSSTLPRTTRGRVYSNGLLYAKTDLAMSQHTLTFDNDNGAGQIGLDYVEIISVTGGSPIVPPSRASSPSASSSITPSTTSSLPLSRTSSVPPTTQSLRSKPAPNATPSLFPVGIIVGAIVGALVIAVIIGLAFFLYQRKSSPGKSPSWQVDDDHTPPATPFTSRARGFVSPRVVRSPKTPIITRDTNTLSYPFPSALRSELTTGASDSSSQETLAAQKPVVRPRSQVDDPPPLYIP